MITYLCKFEKSKGINFLMKFAPIYQVLALLKVLCFILHKTINSKLFVLLAKILTSDLQYFIVLQELHLFQESGP